MTIDGSFAHGHGIDCNDILCSDVGNCQMHDLDEDVPRTSECRYDDPDSTAKRYYITGDSDEELSHTDFCPADIVLSDCEGNCVAPDSTSSSNCCRLEDQGVSCQTKYTYDYTLDADSIYIFSFFPFDSGSATGCGPNWNTCLCEETPPDTFVVDNSFRVIMVALGFTNNIFGVTQAITSGPYATPNDSCTNPVGEGYPYQSIDTGGDGFYMTMVEVLSGDVVDVYVVDCEGNCLQKFTMIHLDEPTLFFDTSALLKTDSDVVTLYFNFL